MSIEANEMQQGNSAEKTRALKGRVIQQLADSDLVAFLSEMPGDDQIWVFYLLIADAAKRGDALTLHHLRDLLKDGTIEALIQKQLASDIDALRADMSASLKKIDRSIEEIKAIEDDKSIESLAQSVARKVKTDVMSGINEVSAELEQGIERLSRLHKSQAADSEAMTKSISEIVADKISRKLGNINVLFVGVALIFALAFGFMAGRSMSTGYSRADIQTLIKMTATETAEHMRSKTVTQSGAGQKKQ